MDSGTWLALAMLPAAVLVLLTGYPAAFVLGGLAVLFAIAGSLLGIFDPIVLRATSLRIFGLMTNQTLLAVPLFVFMGAVLERSHLVRDMLLAAVAYAGNRPGGLALAVTATGGMLAAATGVAGATVAMLGMVALPVMLRARYDPATACGVVAASGTLSQLMPPSIALVILADVIGAVHHAVQIEAGKFAPDPVSVVDIFAGALLPGLLLVMLYMTWIAWRAGRRRERQPPLQTGGSPGLMRSALPVACLILAVLGSILGGLAAPGEAAAIGAGGAVLLAIVHGRLTLKLLWQSARSTAMTSAMIFTIIIGAGMFALVFRELGGSEWVAGLLTDRGMGVTTGLAIGMAVIFVLGFFLEFVEITVVAVPLLAAPLLAQGVDPIWLAVLLAINLQTSFLTPPLGVSLFYLRGVAPPEIATTTIFRGALPFIGLQLLLLTLVTAFPSLATALPAWLSR